MARQPTQAEILDALRTKYEAALAAAFLLSFADIVAQADMERLTEALDRGDTEGAIAALHLDPAAFQPMDRTRQEAFIAAGIAVVALLPALTNLLGHRVVVRFDPAAPGAANALQTIAQANTATLLESQRQAVREIVQSRLAANADPKTLALEIVGRINPATGAREGGVIGLSGAQAQFVETARTELQSGDATLLRNYLDRTLRDQRLDAAVQRAIDAGTPVDQATIDRAVQQYSNRLLLARGRTWGLAEAQQSLHAGQSAAMDQAIASGGLNGAQVVGDWRTVGDARVRDTHQMLDGESKPHGVPFRSFSGALMMWPGDTSLGAGPDEIANCRCTLISRIVWQPNEVAS